MLKLQYKCPCGNKTVFPEGVTNKKCHACKNPLTQSMFTKAVNERIPIDTSELILAQTLNQLGLARVEPFTPEVVLEEDKGHVGFHHKWKKGTK